MLVTRVERTLPIGLCDAPLGRALNSAPTGVDTIIDPVWGCLRNVDQMPLIFEFGGGKLPPRIVHPTAGNIDL